MTKRISERSRNTGAVHSWLELNRPKTGRCEHCGEEPEDGTQYASAIRDEQGRHVYLYDVNAYRELCRRCHREWDRLLRTHCANGHLYTAENTGWVRKEGRLTRFCRTCHREGLDRFAQARGFADWNEYQRSTTPNVWRPGGRGRPPKSATPEELAEHERIMFERHGSKRRHRKVTPS